MAAAAAGACVAAAVIMRPIFAPLGIVPFCIAIASGGLARAGLLALIASVGPALLAWSQAVLYGGALTPGYPAFDSFFSADRIAPNARVYIGHLAAAHSFFFFIGLVVAIPLYFTRGTRDAVALRTLVALVAIALLNFALYLPYTTYMGISYIRFMLPAHVAMVVLLAATLSDAAVAAAKLWKPLAAICIAPAVIVVYQGSELFSMVRDAYAGQAHVRLMGHYLRDALPGNAVVVSFVHGTAVAYYTGRPIVRFDLTPTGPPVGLLIEQLRARRLRPVAVIDQQNESGFYESVFNGTPYAKPAWPARANFEVPGSSTIWYFDLTDGERAPDQIPPLDVVR
jgi:hypothetical protein